MFAVRNMGPATSSFAPCSEHDDDLARRGAHRERQSTNQEAPMQPSPHGGRPGRGGERKVS
jgi:hypothetical protein